MALICIPPQGTASFCVPSLSHRWERPNPDLLEQRSHTGSVPRFGRPVSLKWWERPDPNLGLDYYDVADVCGTVFPVRLVCLLVSWPFVSVDQPLRVVREPMKLEIHSGCVGVGWCLGVCVCVRGVFAS